MRLAGRLPPGQSLTLKWPVLHTGAIPGFDPSRWQFRLMGLVEEGLSLSFQELTALPHIEVKADFHCVTRWSKFDNIWEGVACREIMQLARLKPEAQYVMVRAEHGYTANLPLKDLLQPDVLLAWRHNGEDLAPEHGWPLRLVVPKLYAWKSVKWVRALEFMEHDRPGFWERNGYHLYGDPWQEQRYSP
ncbi:MAG: sulfite oxidase-like oxidoreductase [Acidobacteriota bacterium]